MRALFNFSYLMVAYMLLSACSLPPLEPRSMSHAPLRSETQDRKLGRSITQLIQQAQVDRAQNGIYTLEDAHEAFAARALLAREAERSLDVQYYIWRNDKTGLLLLHELMSAANRGVFVRLLLDDGGTNDLDQELLTLNSHPNIEVRLFNPFVWRGWIKPIGYITAFPRTNRRMHNKSFTADSQASILGGRNVGNEYFGATDGVLFSDLDVLVIGPVVEEISGDFDRYWNSQSAYPVEYIVSAPQQLSLTDLMQRGNALLQSNEAQDYRDALSATPFIRNLTEQTLALHWATATLVSDDPQKALGQASKQALISNQMSTALGEIKHSMDLVSPYFVPTQEGTESFIQLRQQGVKIRILTNSLEATDVALVHSGYMKYREPLLAAGVEILEMRQIVPDYADDETKLKFQLASFGSSGSSLHAKTFTVDGERLFVGSFNFDPRSVALNTEMGLLIDSSELAAQVSQAFTPPRDQHSYRLSLTADGDLRWHSTVGDPPPIYSQEPGTRWYHRWTLKLLSWLPIEWLL